MVQVKEKYKKFMFNRRFDQTEDELQQAQSEIEDIFLTGSEKGAGDNLELEKMINEEIPLIEPEPVYIPPTYTQEQLDQAIEQAKKEGMEEGKKQAEAGIMKADADALQKLEGHLAAIKAETDGYAARSEHCFIGVCSIVFRKLMPELEKKGGFAEIEAILKNNFSRLIKEPKLKITVNGDQIPQLKEKLVEIAKKAGFLGKIVVEGKDELKPGDIGIEWDKGGIIRDTSLIMEEVDRILSSYEQLTEKPAE